MKLSKSRLSLATRESLKGHIFLIPFYIGLFVFFAGPLIQSIKFSFQSVTPVVGGYDIVNVGLENFKYIFGQDANYTINLVESLTTLAWKLPVVLVSSLFFAILINRKFKGRVFVRAVFFLPVIIASGLVMDVIQGDQIAGAALSGSSVAGGEISQSTALSNMLSGIGLNDKIIDTVTMITDSMFSTIWQTGIQTVIFLAGLQGIPSTLYEASAVEGATAWENFWKITLPMILPIMLINIVYTIVDSLVNTQNAVMIQVLNNTNNARYGWASAMAWAYFLIVAAILVIIMIVFTKITAASTGGKEAKK
ncbi:MAG: sugar ABC transporter permease [Clostridia bacterium]|nr:sugar ABC transporter permease [Clostridia bacterium]